MKTITSAVSRDRRSMAGAAPSPAAAQGHQGDQAGLNRCEARYKSFDSGRDADLGYDGKRHYCR